jgi:hypothetical protein
MTVDPNRESFIAAMNALGMTTKQAASRLGVSIDTIKNVRTRKTWRRGIPEPLCAEVIAIVAEATRNGAHAKAARTNDVDLIEPPTDDIASGAPDGPAAAPDEPANSADRKPAGDDEADSATPGPDAESAPELPDVMGELLAAARTLQETDARTARAIMKKAIRTKIDGIGKDQLLSALGKSLKLTPRKLGVRWAQCEAEVAEEDAVPLTPEELAACAEAEAKAKAEAEARVKADTEALYEKCREIAEATDLIFGMIKIVQRLGVVGERKAILAAYLAASSRLNRRKALSLLRRGSAASGKSYVVDQVLKLFPADQIIRSSGASPKALPYYDGAKNEDALAHHIVYIPEAASIADKKGVENEFTTMMRTLISENRLDYQTVMLVKGQTPITIHIKKNGPIAVLITSARPNVEEELLTRLVVVDADESDAQTSRVVDSLLKDQDGELVEGAAEVERWKAFQEWLGLGGPYAVSIPYLEAVRQAYHAHVRGVPLRFRRDLGSYITAIRTSAIIHRAQRGSDVQGRIVADCMITASPI